MWLYGRINEGYFFILINPVIGFTLFAGYLSIPHRVTRWRVHAISCWGLAQVVKGWGGFVGGSRFNIQWGKNLPIKKKKNVYIYKGRVHAIQDSLCLLLGFSLPFLTPDILPSLGHPYHTEGLTCLAITSDSTLALTGSKDGSVHIVNIATGKVWFLVAFDPLFLLPHFCNCALVLLI